MRTRIITQLQRSVSARRARESKSSMCESKSMCGRLVNIMRSYSRPT